MKIEIRDSKTIATIIDYLDLPISKKASSIIYFGPQTAMVVYGFYGDDNYQSIPVQFYLDVDMTYCGKFEMKLFTREKPVTTLVLTQDNFKVRCYYNEKGRLKYDNFYIASLD